MGGIERIEFPEADFDALIFDLDGTLVDSMPVHFESWCKALEIYGAAGILGEDVFYAMGGRPTHDIVVDLNGEHGLKLDPEAICFAKREWFRNNLQSVELCDEVVEFARSHAGKVPLAVATGSTRLGAELTLQAVGLSDLFDEVVTADDVKCGKPAPDIYLETASRIEVAPERCVAFEDAPAGIMAAQSAGMRVIAVPAPVRVVS
jgi:beta-phosphoglucomutase-like phosphatase (HAD superfamily)